VAEDHAFGFTSRDLLDSPSAASLLRYSKSQQLLKRYEKWYGSSFQFHAMLGELSDDAPDSFNTFKSLAAFYKSMLQGLDLLHSMQLAHCDLKKLNVRMSHSGTALITDFGITTNTANSVNFVPKLGFVKRLHPPEYLIYVNMTSTYEAHDKFAAGMMLLDWLYYPCQLNANPQRHWIATPEQLAMLREEFARNHYTLQGVALLKNGVDVRDRFSEKYLQQINVTREASIYIYDNISIFGKAALIRNLLYCPSPQMETLPVNEKKEHKFLDLALQLLAVEPDDRISIHEARKHVALWS